MIAVILQYLKRTFQDFIMNVVIVLAISSCEVRCVASWVKSMSNFFYSEQNNLT